MAGSVARAHHSTRSPGETPAGQRRRPARPCGRRGSPRPPPACVSQPSIRTGASGRAAHCRAHTSGRVRPTHREARRPAIARPGRAPSPPATAGHSLAVMTARRIAIVPHTHWDREWYKSYQDFRLALVELIDTLLPLLERDASYPHFMLDGQMAVVDDYLEVRPEAEERLRALAAAGRLSMGPWYILMDEFLASGETIVRNLQMGLGRGAAFGGVMELGYLPDMFGHIAQMPQILRLAGFQHAVVWRGVPSAGDQERLHLGVARRLLGPGRVPARRLRQRGGPARRRQGPDPPHERQRRRGGRVPDGRPAVHERFGPPHAPALARAGRGRGQRPAGRLRLRGHLAPPLPGQRPHRRADAGEGRAPLGRPVQHADGRHLQPGRRQAPWALSPSGNWSGGPSRWPRSSRRRPTTPTACWSWPGWRWCATPPTTPSAPARSTTWSTPSSTATPRRAPSPPDWRTGPSRPSPGRCPTPDPRC